MSFMAPLFNSPRASGRGRHPRPGSKAKAGPEFADEGVKDGDTVIPVRSAASNESVHGVAPSIGSSTEGVVMEWNIHPYRSRTSFDWIRSYKTSTQ